MAGWLRRTEKDYGGGHGRNDEPHESKDQRVLFAWAHCLPFAAGRDFRPAGGDGVGSISLWLGWPNSD